MPVVWFQALVGGLLIGAASSLLLLTHGRIAGISGVIGSILSPKTTDRSWQLMFVSGLLATGVVAGLVAPSSIGHAARSYPVVILAGVLVGFGTRLGGGCTSGHGVCGIGRLSTRSLVAVATFMVAGALTTLVAGGAS
jgi:uncharacterized membrane protein YedE/YeeE